MTVRAYFDPSSKHALARRVALLFSLCLASKWWGRVRDRRAASSCLLSRLRGSSRRGRGLGRIDRSGGADWWKTTGFSNYHGCRLEAFCSPAHHCQPSWSSSPNERRPTELRRRFVRFKRRDKGREEILCEFLRCFGSNDEIPDAMLRRACCQFPLVLLKVRPFWPFKVVSSGFTVNCWCWRWYLILARPSSRSQLKMEGSVLHTWGTSRDTKITILLSIYCICRFGGEVSSSPEPQKEAAVGRVGVGGHAALRVRMTEGPRNRSCTGGSGQRERSDPGGDAGVGVALKQQIGLVSACGIIIGEYVSRELCWFKEKYSTSAPEWDSHISICSRYLLTADLTVSCICGSHWEGVVEIKYLVWI